MSELDERLEEVHQLYCQAYEKCRRADREGKGYIGFRRHKDGFRLIVTDSNCGGKSSARLGLLIPDWASNVLYRLQEEGFIYDMSLDEYFERLQAVGYNRRA